MRSRMSLRALYILAALFPLLLPADDARAQEIRVMEVGMAHLSPTEDTDTPGKVRWSFKRSGTRTSNVGCGIETEFTNSTGELRFRLTDYGGLQGDPGCTLSLKFDQLKNSYTFDGVTVETTHCGNSPCKASVVRASAQGSSSLDVVVHAGMKGVLIGFPSRKSMFRVRAKLRGPAGLSPFVD